MAFEDYIRLYVYKIAYGLQNTQSIPVSYRLLLEKFYNYFHFYPFLSQTKHAVCKRIPDDTKHTYNGVGSKMLVKKSGHTYILRPDFQVSLS